MNLKKNSFLISGTALTGSVMTANAVNLLFNAYLGRVVSPEEFGIIALINTFMYIGGMFYLSLSSTVINEVGNLETRVNTQAASGFLSYVTKQVLLANLGIAFIWAILSPWTSVFFHIESPLVLLLFTPLLIFYPLVAVGRGYLQGRLFFVLTGCLMLLEPVIKLLSAWFLIELNLHEFIYISIYISAIATGITAILVAWYHKSKPTPQKYSFPRKFFAASLLTGVSTISFLALDMVLVKHFLTPLEAGQYAFLSLLGKIVYFLGALLNIFTITIVSREFSSKKNSSISFYLIFAGSAGLCAVGVTALGVFGSFFIPLIFGGRADSVIPYALPYVSAIALFTLGSIIVTYHLARKNYFFPFLSLGLSSLLTIGILIFNSNLTQIVYVLLIAGVIYIVGLLLAHIYKEHFTAKKITIDSVTQGIDKSL